MRQATIVTIMLSGVSLCSTPGVVARDVPTIRTNADLDLGGFLGGEDEHERCDDRNAGVEDLLECLRSGDWESRSTAIEWLPDALGLTGHGNFPGPRTGDEAIDLVIRVMHDEEDDWIARLLLDDLLYSGAEGLERLFRAALRAGSINLRAKAIEWLANEEDPGSCDDLESLWAAGVPDWLLPALVGAVARQGMVDHVDEVIELTGATDPEVRSAAIEALGTLGAEEGRKALLSLARHGPTNDRAEALGSLAGLPSTRETLEVMERALRSAEPMLRSASLAALSYLDHEDADVLLMQVLEESTEDVDLLDAVDGLEDSEHPDATRAIARVLGRIDPGTSERLARQVLNTLHNRDDAEALPWLLALESKVRAALGDNLVTLIEYLSGNRSDEGGSISVTTGCFLGSYRVDSADPRARRIAPRPPFETVRCWAAPSVAGESWDEDRPAAGTLVRIEEYFERPEGTWVLVEGEEADCWVPMVDLAAVDTPPPDDDPTRPPRVEFDLPVDEVRSRAARYLIRHGLMVVLEPETDLDVVAVAVSVDPADPEQVALLDEALDGGGETLEEMLDDFRRACCGPLP